MGPESAMGVLVVAETEMARGGFAAILDGMPEVRDYTVVHPADFVARPRWDDVHVLIMSCADNPEAQRHGQASQLVSQAREHGISVLLALANSDSGDLNCVTNLPCDGVLYQEEVTTESLHSALGRLRNGEMPMPAKLARKLLECARDGRGAPGTVRTPLTPREQQVLELLADGLSNKQIARTLTISEHSTKRLVANVLFKLSCPNRTLAVAVALRDGLLQGRS